MRYVKKVNGKIAFFGGTLTVPGVPIPDKPDQLVEDLIVLNPTHEMILEAGWSVYDEPTVETEQIIPPLPLEDKITDLQLAVCEIYEMIGGGLDG